jgi:hypothetical protein
MSMKSLVLVCALPFRGVPSGVSHGAVRACRLASLFVRTALAGCWYARIMHRISYIQQIVECGLTWIAQSSRSIASLMGAARVNAPVLPLQADRSCASQGLNRNLSRWQPHAQCSRLLPCQHDEPDQSYRQRTRCCHSAWKRGSTVRPARDGLSLQVESKHSGRASHGLNRMLRL